MLYSTEVQHMCPVAKGAYHGPAPIPEEGKWVQAKEIRDISGLTHGVGWCAPQQGGSPVIYRGRPFHADPTGLQILLCRRDSR